MGCKRHRRSPIRSPWCSSHLPVPEPEAEKTSHPTCSPVLPSGLSFLIWSGATSAFSLCFLPCRLRHWPLVQTCPTGGRSKIVKVELGSRSLCSFCASVLDMRRFSPTVPFSTARTGTSPLKTPEANYFCFNSSSRLARKRRSGSCCASARAFS